MARVNILRRLKTSKGWGNVALKRNARGRVQWPSGGRFLIEWREDGRRLRASAGDTPAEALEAQKRKRLELEAGASGLELSGIEEEERLPLAAAIQSFLKDIKTFRKKLTWQKYEYVLELFAEYAAPKTDARDIDPEDINKEVPRLAQVEGLRPGHHPLHRPRDPPQLLQQTRPRE